MKIIECPRDAMQGYDTFIPTDIKTKYLRKLMQVGFHTLDFGSFVSTAAVPQMADTPLITPALAGTNSDTKLLAIIANKRGAEEAAKFNHVHQLGYPFSVSETFQLRNTNKGIAHSFELVKELHELCETKEKELVIYISMGFGNPYGDKWSPSLVEDWAGRISTLGIGIISVADTVGVAKPDDVFRLFERLVHALAGVEIGAHLHAPPDKWFPVIEAAYEGGCRRFDGAIKGYGGCPMAEDKLTGNIATENLVAFLESKNQTTGIDGKLFSEAMKLSSTVFN